MGKKSRFVNKQGHSPRPRAVLLPRLSGLLMRGAPEAASGVAGESVIVFGFH